jgi:stearoyl-CoA desaturase (delta-9 desaturase)
VLPGQLDPAARLIWLLEKAGWVFDVRWPVPRRFKARRVSAEKAVRSER